MMLYPRMDSRRRPVGQGRLAVL